MGGLALYAYSSRLQTRPRYAPKRPAGFYNTPRRARVKLAPKAIGSSGGTSVGAGATKSISLSVASASGESSDTASSDTELQFARRLDARVWN